MEARATHTEGIEGTPAGNAAQQRQIRSLLQIYTDCETQTTYRCGSLCSGQVPDTRLKGCVHGSLHPGSGCLKPAPVLSSAVCLHAASEPQVIPGEQQQPGSAGQGAYDSPGSSARAALAAQPLPVSAPTTQQTAGQPLTTAQQLAASLATSQQAEQPVLAPAAAATQPSAVTSSAAAGPALLTPGPSQLPPRSPLNQQSARPYASGGAPAFGLPWEAIAAAQNQAWVDPVYGLGPSTSQQQESWPAWQTEPLLFAQAGAGQPVQAPPTWGQLGAQTWPSGLPGRQQGVLGATGQGAVYQQQPLELQWPGPPVDPETASRQRDTMPLGLRLTATRTVSGWRGQASQQEQPITETQDAPRPMQVLERTPISSQPSAPESLGSIPELGERAVRSCHGFWHRHLIMFAYIPCIRNAAIRSHRLPFRHHISPSLRCCPPLEYFSLLEVLPPFGVHD